MIYDWLVALGGGEKVLEMVSDLFPGDVHTLIADPKVTPKLSLSGKIRTSFLQKWLFRFRKYQNLLPLYPLAIEKFDLSSYDLVLSISHSCAKGVLTNHEQTHICYCFTPMRYAWDFYHEYMKDCLRGKPVRRFFAKCILHYLRIWDASSSKRVDEFIAISHFVARRIEKIYQRKSIVIYPPVDTDYFSFVEKKEDFYISVSRFVPYKKMETIARAFAHLPNKRLILIGDGPERKRIEKIATPNVTLLGWVSQETLRSHLQKAKAFIFAAKEDFGIAPVEAMSCGTPVIAYNQGGALETVVDKKTGLFFSKQTPSSIAEAVERFSTMTFHLKEVRQQAEKFSKERFKKEFSEAVSSIVKKRKESFAL